MNRRAAIDLLDRLFLDASHKKLDARGQFDLRSDGLTAKSPLSGA
jgi:hypothetical protein